MITSDLNKIIVGTPHGKHAIFRLRFARQWVRDLGLVVGDEIMRVAHGYRSVGGTTWVNLPEGGPLVVNGIRASEIEFVEYR